MVIILRRTNDNLLTSYTCISTLAPSAPPDLISIDSIYSESIYLSWRPSSPEYHNGDVIGYYVTFTATNSEEVFTTFSAANSTRIMSLDPFITYTISVAAATGVGIGPYSTPVTFVTNEAGRVIRTGMYCESAMIYVSHVL